MSRTRTTKKVGSKRKKSPQNGAKPKSLGFADRGISTTADFAEMMTEVIGDVIAGRITPGQANAASNAAGRVLKTVELQLKYGSKQQQDSAMTLIGKKPK